MSVITGHDYTEHLTGTSAVDTINALGGADLVEGGGGGDTIYGGDGDDRLFSGSSGDVQPSGQGAYLYGGDGSDQVSGGATDHLDGGTGLYDTFSLYLADRPSRVVDLSSFGSTGGFQLDDGTTVSNFDRGSISFSTSEHLVVVLGTSAIAVAGGPGDDRLIGAGANDHLEGGAGADTLVGAGGNDMMIGGGGADTLYGGGGDDNLTSGSLLYGGVGNDTVSNYGEPGGYTADGGSGNDSIIAELSYADAPDLRGITYGTFTGVDGTVIRNFEHAYVILDGTADMTLDLAGLRNVQLLTGSGNDHVAASGRGSFVDGLAGDDSLFGRAGDDGLTGANGDDFLFGGAGADTLQGGFQHDRLYGGGGADVLTGGAQSDAFVFRTLAELNGDTITDLGADRIVVARIDADTTQPGRQSFSLVSAFDGHAGEIVASYDGTATHFDFYTSSDATPDASLTALGDQRFFTNFET